MSNKYSDTVFLPQTSVPMKADLLNQEPKLLQYWDDINLYGLLREKSKGKTPFVLHWGPPYANGNLHAGHALSSILKDIINKIAQMSGYNADLLPGWDCHGLPIEWKVEEGLREDEYDIFTFRQKCRDFAEHWANAQKIQFQRLGIIANWQDPYYTMDYTSQASILECVQIALHKGLIYRGYKPVLWSVEEKTALAEAEVEYKMRISHVLTVALPVEKTLCQGIDYIPIWTTTPWSLPGNRAVAYSNNIEYVIVKIEDGIYKDKTFATAIDLLDNIVQWGASWTVVSYVKGSAFQGTTCRHPLYDFEVPLLPSDHVTKDVGTGFVHIAPEHGNEDFYLCIKNNIAVPRLVEEDGRYSAEVPLFAGLHICKVHSDIIDTLKEKGLLIHHSHIEHSCPHSWRSKSPLIYRATDQWFVNLTDLKNRALQEIDNVQWYPEQSINRIGAMVAGREYWCISRQRRWGVPLGIFVHKQTKEPLIDINVSKKIVSAFEEFGADWWFTEEIYSVLSDEQKADYEPIYDTVDVWFDSGATQEFVVKKRLSYPADLYVEGSDQHRGWFQSSLLVGCIVNDRAPYKKVITHGFLLDQEGYKLSKSLGNAMDVVHMTAMYGADIIRLWVVSADFFGDIRFGPALFNKLDDVYRKFRNVLRYLSATLRGFEDIKDHVEVVDEMNKWLLHRIYMVHKDMTSLFESYDLQKAYANLYIFCTNELSAFFFDIKKDALYCGDKATRREIQYVFSILFQYLLRWLAPVLSFTTEEIFLLRYPNEGSIHLQEFLCPDASWYNPSIEEKVSSLIIMRKLVLSALEFARNQSLIGSSLEAEVDIFMQSTVRDKYLLSDIDLADFFIVSAVRILDEYIPMEAFIMDDIDGIGVVVHQSTKAKCVRCRKHNRSVAPFGTDGNDLSTDAMVELKKTSKVVESDICQRCIRVVELS